MIPVRYSRLEPLASPQPPPDAELSLFKLAKEVLTSVKPGADVTNINLPASILDPVSTLEKAKKSMQRGELLQDLCAQGALRQEAVQPRAGRGVSLRLCAQGKRRRDAAGGRAGVAPPAHNRAAPAQRHARLSARLAHGAGAQILGQQSGGQAQGRNPNRAGSL
ncbi:Oxysterol-binding protein [Gracilaria domingensis]|nr:Oxysterol-binding protein [Gracilaria domingensis]